MKKLNILSLGAGVQSTTVYLMSLWGELEPLDAAIFADTGEEPSDVYRHLDWLLSLNGPKIYVRSAGKLGDDLVNGRNSTGQSFASIPAFTAAVEGQKLGIVRRQCTSEYKVAVVEKCIRRELLGLEPRQRVPSDVIVNQWMGFSFDEPGRAARTRQRETKWQRFRFPLIDLEMTRGDCLRYLDEHKVSAPRSACVFCPFRSDKEWRHLKERDPEGWARAVEIDNALRTPGRIVNRNLDEKFYVHQSCVPLERANLREDQGDLFNLDCEGGCGL